VPGCPLPSVTDVVKAARTGPAAKQTISIAKLNIDKVNRENAPNALAFDKLVTWLKIELLL